MTSSRGTMAWGPDVGASIAARMAVRKPYPRDGSRFPGASAQRTRETTAAPPHPPRTRTCARSPPFRPWPPFSPPIFSRCMRFASSLAARPRFRAARGGCLRRAARFDASGEFRPPPRGSPGCCGERPEESRRRVSAHRAGSPSGTAGCQIVSARAGLGAGTVDPAVSSAPGPSSWHGAVPGVQAHVGPGAGQAPDRRARPPAGTPRPTARGTAATARWTRSRTIGRCRSAWCSR